MSVSYFGYDVLRGSFSLLNPCGSVGSESNCCSLQVGVGRAFSVSFGSSEWTIVFRVFFLFRIEVV